MVEKKPPLYPDLEEGEVKKELLEVGAGDEEQEEEEEARTLPVVLAVLAVSFGSYIHGSSIVFPDVRSLPPPSHASLQIALAGIKIAASTALNSTSGGDEVTELGYEYDDTRDKAWISKLGGSWHS